MATIGERGRSLYTSPLGGVYTLHRWAEHIHHSFSVVYGILTKSFTTLKYSCHGRIILTILRELVEHHNFMSEAHIKGTFTIADNGQEFSSLVT